jgi:hypothetical protein
MNSSSIKAGKSKASSIKQLSADEETRRVAFVRERARRDEVSLLNDAEKGPKPDERLSKGMDTGLLIMFPACNSRFGHQSVRA